MLTVGVGLAQEFSREKTYFETDLNTGECRDIATKPKSSLPSTTKSQLSESLSVGSGVNTSLQNVSSSQRFSGSYVTPSQSLLPEKPATFGYHGIGNSVTASGLGTSGISDVTYTGSRNPPVAGSGFPSDDVRKFSAEMGRTEPRSGVYSLASSRPLVQKTTSKPGADQRLGPDAAKVDYQRGQAVRDNAGGTQQFSNGRQLQANIPSLPVQVSSVSLYNIQVFIAHYGNNHHHRHHHHRIRLLNNFINWHVASLVWMISEI